MIYIINFSKMKLTTKRNRWYFWRELFSYMIPMILIAWALDLFTSFIQCPLHPEWSAPCSVIWINAVVYWFFLLLAIIFAIISSRKLRKVKKQIENEFIEAANSSSMNTEKKDSPKVRKTSKKNISTRKSSISKKKSSKE